MVPNWTSTGNWATSVVPGAGDIAQFGVDPTGGTQLGIKFDSTSNNGTQNQILGAIELTSSRASGNLTLVMSQLLSAGLALAGI